MVALTGEKVDVHFLRDDTNGEWDLITPEVTRTLPVFPDGLNPIKMVVRCDHYMAVLPPRTRAVASTGRSRRPSL